MSRLKNLFPPHRKHLAIVGNSKQKNGMRREILICVVLVVVTLFAFWPVGHLGFMLYDDHHYVSENPNVQAGITADSIRWAFTATR